MREFICRIPRDRLFQIDTQYRIGLIRALLVCGLLLSSHAQANGLLEVVGGGSWATGGELENLQNWGGQITLGWGGRTQSTEGI